MLTDTQKRELKQRQNYYDVAVESLLVVMKEVEDESVPRKIAQQLISVVARRDPLNLEGIARDLRAFRRVMIPGHYNALREAERREREKAERDEANRLFELVHDETAPIEDRLQAKRLLDEISY